MRPLTSVDKAASTPTAGGMAVEEHIPALLPSSPSGSNLASRMRLCGPLHCHHRWTLSRVRAGASARWLPRRRDRPELLQQTEGVLLDEVLHDPAVHDAEQADPGACDGFPGRGDTQERALLGAAPGPTNRHLVPLGEKVLHCDRGVGKCAAQRAQEPQEAVAVHRGIASVVDDVAGREQLVGEPGVAGADEPFPEPPDESLVVSCGHRLTLL